MADTKISELPVATAIASPDVAPIVQGGVTKQADVSLFGSFLSTNIARVDPTGNDATGAIGNLNKPFLTVQAAITYVEAIVPIPDWPVIDIGNNTFSEDITTSLPRLAFIGRRPVPVIDALAVKNTPFNSFTFNASSSPQVLILKDCNARSTTITGNTDSSGGFGKGFILHLLNSYAGTVSNDVATPKMSVYGYGNSFVDSLQDNSGGGTIDVHELSFAPDGQIFGQSDTTWNVFNTPTDIKLGPSNGILNLSNSPVPILNSFNSAQINIISPTFLPLTNSAGNATILGITSKNGIPDVSDAGFEKGSICMDTANGKLYVNGGDAATPDWRLVVSV